MLSYKVLVYILLSLYPKLDVAQVDTAVQAIVSQAQEASIDPLLAVATAVVDSKLDTKKVTKTPKGCKVGLYQILIKNCEKKQVVKFQQPDTGAAAGIFFMALARSKCDKLQPSMVKDCRDNGYYLALLSSSPSYYEEIIFVYLDIVAKLQKATSAEL